MAGLGFSITPVNLPQFQGNLASKSVKLSKAIDMVTKKTATFIRAEAARNTPTGKAPPEGSSKNPGNLKRGWSGPKQTGKWEYEVENAVEYALYVENGTWKMAGRHMLASAVHRAEPMHKAAIMAAIKVIL